MADIPAEQTTMNDIPAEQFELNPSLVERETEMRFLDQKMDQATHTMGSVVLISGEPGMGKTRLMDEAEELARERGLLFLRGTGDARRAGLAYGVFVEELGVYLDHVSAEERGQLREAVGELAPHLWSRLFPTEEPPPASPDMNPQLRQSLFLSRLGRLLLNLARRQPLVLCLEDLHWADSASLQLLSFLATRNADIPLLILATFRPGQQEGQEGLDLEKMLREMGMKKHFHLLNLKPLSDAGSRSMVASCFANEQFSERLLLWLHRKSGGVPLFVIQYLEFVLEKGVIYEKAGLWLDRSLKEKQEPDSVRSLLQQRLQKLSQEERQILSFAAVQGDRFEGRLVARTLGAPFTTVMRTLANLMRRTRLVRTEERKLCFSHTLLTEFFYEQLSSDERRRVHLRLGSILEEEKQGDAEVLAYHFYHAGFFSRAVPYLLEAAHRARAAFAFREAMRFLDQAQVAIGGLEPEKVQKQRLEILLMRGGIEDRTGVPDQAQALCRQVLEFADPVKDRMAVGRALLLMGWLEYRRGDWEEAIKLHWDAQGIFTELNDEQKSALVYVRLGNIAFERGQLDEAEARFRDAKDAAIKHADYYLQGTVHGNLAIIATVRGRYIDAVLGYTEALKAYRKINHTYGLCQTYHNLGMTHSAQREWEEASKCYERGWQLAREMGTIDVEANILVSRAVAQIGLGELNEADASCQGARAHYEQLDDRLGVAECDKVDGMIHRERAQFAEAQERLERGRHCFEALENRLGVAECDLELGRLFHIRGEADTARLRLQESQRLFQEIGAEADAQRAGELLATLAS